MAVRTTIAHDKDWNDPTAWDTGVPVDNDSFVLNHRIIFNVDQSAMPNGMVGWTCNVGGKLTASTTPGTYYLKMKGNATGAASPALEVGSLATPYPTNCSFTILMNGNFSLQFSAAGAYQIYGKLPTVASIRLTSAASAGAITLNVDTDVTGYPADWFIGAEVRVDDVNSSSVDSESRTIAGMTATTITLNSGLTNAKDGLAPDGKFAWVHLATRNVTFRGIGSTTNIIIQAGTSGIFRCRFDNAANHFSGGIGHDVQNSIATVGTSNFITSSVVPITKNTIVSGCAVGINSSSSPLIDNVKMTGNTTGLLALRNMQVVGGVFAGCTNGISASDGRVVNASLYGNARDINQGYGIKFYNTLLASATEHLNYNSVNMQAFDYNESFDHDQVVGDFRSWDRGGITSKNSSTLTTPRGVKSHQTVLESASFPGFWQQEVTVEAGQRLSFTAWLRKSATMTIKPRVQVFLAGNDPLITGAAPLSENIMSDSVNTWESFTVSMANSSYPKTYVIRFQGQNATGTMDTDLLLQRDVITTREFDMYLRTGDTASFSALYLDAATLLAKTGLTVTADVYRDGTQLVNDGAAVEVGDGLYKYDYSNTPIAGIYRAVFKTTTSGVVVNVMADRAQVGGWVDLLSAGDVTLLSPLTADGGTMNVEQGDDYKNVDGRAFGWTLPSAVSGSGVWKFGTVSVFSKSIDILSPTSVRLELTRAETLTFKKGVYDFQLEFTLANGDTITPLEGRLRVKKNIG